MSRIILSLAVVLCATAAHADRDAGWVLGAQAGLGSPLGLIGIEGGWVITPNFTWTGGVGLGLDNTPQVGTMMRLATSGPGLGAGLGAGLSAGGWTGMEAAWAWDDYRLDADWLGFANVELSVHYQFEFGGLLRLTGGVQNVIAGDIVCTSTSPAWDDSNDCRGNNAANKDELFWPYLAVGIEY